MPHVKRQAESKEIDLSAAGAKQFEFYEPVSQETYLCQAVDQSDQKKSKKTPQEPLQRNSTYNVRFKFKNQPKACRTSETRAVTMGGLRRGEPKLQLQLP